MADRLRVVTAVDTGTPSTLLDVNDGSIYALVAGTFKITPPESSKQFAQSGRRYGGAKLARETHGNGAVGAEWYIKGSSHDDSITKMEALLAEIESTQTKRWLEWRPQGATNSVYYEIRGPGEWEPMYRWVEFQANQVLHLSASWSVAPLAQGLPQTVMTFNSQNLPQDLRLSNIEGTAPALAEVTVETAAGASAAPVWAMLAWAARAPIHNMLWNGNFESSAAGWSVAAVTGINAAATSITRVTTSSKFGAASGEVVTPATSGSGANFKMYRKFRAGVTYTIRAWVRSASQTTSLSIRIGNLGGTDVVTSTGTALSSTWTERTLTWTPSADRNGAYFAAIINAATATTFQIDGVQVYEGTTQPTIGRHAQGEGGLPPFGIIEAEAYSALTGAWVETADSTNFRGDFGLRGTAVSDSTWTAEYPIDPSLITPDDYTDDEIAVEVWGRFQANSAFTPRVVASLRPAAGTDFGSERFTDEFGQAGKLMAADTAYRFVRLGTLRMVANRDRGGIWRLVIKVIFGTGASATYGMDYLLLVPARARALNPTGKSGSVVSFPAFIPSTNATSKVIYPDLRGAIGEPGGILYPDHGLGGSVLEFPPGSTDLLVKLSNWPPDELDTSINEIRQYTANVSVKVTPRWRLAR